jgi:hypothetical protein
VSSWIGVVISWSLIVMCLAGNWGWLICWPDWACFVIFHSLSRKMQGKFLRWAMENLKCFPFCHPTVWCCVAWFTDSHKIKHKKTCSITFWDMSLHVVLIDLSLLVDQRICVCMHSCTLVEQRICVCMHTCTPAYERGGGGCCRVYLHLCLNKDFCSCQLIIWSLCSFLYSQKFCSVL